MACTEEIVALVDEDGAVVGGAPRSRVRRENLPHASTAVLVRRPDRSIYLHRRAAEKDWQPSAHDAAAGGVVRHGESPEASARRELAEELGVTGVALRPLLTHRYEDDTVRCLAHCFEVEYDGEVTHADGEVVWGDWVELSELGRLLRDPGWPFVPDTRSVLARLCRERVGDYAGLMLEEMR